MISLPNREYDFALSVIIEKLLLIKTNVCETIRQNSQKNSLACLKK